MGSGEDVWMMRPLRRGLALPLTLVVGSALGVLVAMNAFAAEGTRSTCLRASYAPPDCPVFPALQVTIEGAVRPGALPKQKTRPVALELEGRIATRNGTHPSALRELVVDLDRDIAIDARGLPICQQDRRDLRRSLGQIERLCHDAIVGGGRADFEVVFPEQKPVKVSSKMVVFNDTSKGRPITLVAAAEVYFPAPTIVAMPIEISRGHTGGYGLHAVAKVPVIAGGSGSLLDFDLRIKRLFDYGQQKKSLVSARCSDSVFKLDVPKILFRNEAHTPGVAAMTTLKGSIAAPCSPLD